MTSTALKFALGQAIKGKKKEHDKNKEVQQNSTDPFYYFPNGGTKSRDRRERPRPAEVRSDNDWSILRTVRRRAHRLDQSREILGIKFGLSSIIGLVPVVGDFLEVFLSLLLIRKCSKIDGGLPVGIKVRMLIYIVLDFVLGLVPLLGDLVDVAFRANTRISWRLEKYLIEKAGGDLEEASVATAGVIEPSQSTPALPPRQHSRTGPADRSDDVPLRPVPAAVTAGGRRDRPQRTRTGPR